MKTFLDTNILVYSQDSRDERKHKIACDLIADLIGEGNGVISTQALWEYANVGISKIHQPERIVATRVMQFNEWFQVIPQSAMMLADAVRIKSVFQMSLWDASILSAAKIAECSVVLSEGLNAGQCYDGVMVVNPFSEIR